MHPSNPWIQTLSGQAFHYKDPKPEEVNIFDIAGALARQCRYGGHCHKFYSVAEHCVHVASKASNHLKLTALMHDASEAYLVDIPRPVKPLLANYYELENQIMEVISERFVFEWPMPDEIKQLDTAILTDERIQNMTATCFKPEDWGNLLPGLGIDLQFWSHYRAANEFLSAFHRYGGRP